MTFDTILIKLEQGELSAEQVKEYLLNVLTEMHESDTVYTDPSFVSVHKNAIECVMIRLDLKDVLGWKGEDVEGGEGL